MEAIAVQLHDLNDDPKARPALVAAGVCSACLLVLLYCISVTRSLVLTASAWLTVFSALSLCAALVSQRARRSQATLRYSYGYARAPVLAVFGCTVLAQLSAIFLMKESVELLLEGEAHGHSHWVFLPGTAIACAAQLVAAYGVRNEPMWHVLNAASSSWLQEHAADVSQALCRFVPGLSRFLLPRLNALGLLATLAAGTSVGSYVLLEHYGFWWADAAGALCLSLSVFGTFAPLSAYTGRILLQTSPPHAAIQLDKCVREAETLDGVLEVTQVHFWQLDFSRMAGTVVVRVRREADEQRVMAHVTEKLSACVAELTVQVVKSADTAALRASAAGTGMSPSYSWHDFGDKPHRQRHPSGHDGYPPQQQHQAHGHGHSHADDGHGHSHAAQDAHGHSHAYEPHGHAH